MKTPIFTGACVAIVTPYNENGIDFDKLGELIELQIAGGTSAITICGTTGEASTQTIEEHKAAIEYCVKKVDHRVKVIAGTGSNCTMTALDLSLYAESCGVDGLLIATSRTIYSRDESNHKIPEPVIVSIDLTDVTVY